MLWDNFKLAVEQAGLVPHQCSLTHWQIHGGLRIINIYARTKRGFAFYIQGTASGKRNSSVHEAILAATNPLKAAKSVKKAERKRNYVVRKRILLRRNPHCHWCKIGLTIESATLDHVIALSRGGSDGMDNTVIACDDCNQRRKNQTTNDELKQTQKQG